MRETTTGIHEIPLIGLVPAPNVLSVRADSIKPTPERAIPRRVAASSGFATAGPGAWSRKWACPVGGMAIDGVNKRPRLWAGWGVGTGVRSGPDRRRRLPGGWTGETGPDLRIFPDWGLGRAAGTDPGPTLINSRKTRLHTVRIVKHCFGLGLRPVSMTLSEEYAGPIILTV